MRILLVTPYYLPEEVGPAIWLRELTAGLVARGHQLTVATAFPNHPERVVFPAYRGKVFMRERIDEVDLVRTYIYASPSHALWKRALSFGSFCVTSVVGGLASGKQDVIYCVLPPLPLGLSAALVGLAKRAPLVVNVQDIYPDILVSLGYLRNRWAISLLRGMEDLVYRLSSGIVVISDGFKENLLGKGVPSAKLHVVPNWADAEWILPGPKQNSFRRQIGSGQAFTLIYSGGLTHNSNVEPLIEAADLLRNERFSFAIVGDGVRKASLERQAADKDLHNVFFFPFQPKEAYPQVLAAADMGLVTLAAGASNNSVPSKVFKIMSAARPVLAIAPPCSDLARLVQNARCGLCVPPDDPKALAEALRYAAAHPDQLAAWGACARQYLQENYSLSRCVDQIEAVLRQAVSK